MSALDGYFEFEATSVSQGGPDSMQTDSGEDMGQDLINSVCLLRENDMIMAKLIVAGSTTSL